MRSLTCVLALAGLLAVPATGNASVDFGSRLNNQPVTGACNQLIAPCTYAGFEFSSPPNGDPYRGGAPIAGVITRFKIRGYGENGQPGTATFGLATVSLANPPNPTVGLARAVAKGPTVTVAGNGDNPEIFNARVPVAKGNQLTLDTSNVNAIPQGGGSDTFGFSSPLVVGAGPRASNEGFPEMQVAATIEPDKDGDGFGDETQDRCPTQKTAGAACDTTRPSVGSLKLTRSRITFSLSEAATVKLSLQKAKSGRKVRGKCRKPSRKNALARRCTRYVKVKGVTVKGVKGSNKVKLSKTLAKGRYRIVGVATDAAGNKRTFTKKFRIRAARTGKFRTSPRRSPATIRGG